MKFSNLIKSLSFATFFLVATIVKADGVVVLSDNASDYTQTETGYVLNFKLEITAVELDQLNADIAMFNEGFGSEVITMTSQLISEGKYACVYTVDHQNQPEYVHKMMLSCGFSSIKYKDETYGLDKIIEILYAYQ